MLNSPEVMVKLRVMTLRDHSEKTLKILHRLGVLHVEQSAELKAPDREAIAKGNHSPMCPDDWRCPEGSGDDG